MASNDFPLDEAQIVALFMESMFFGIYCVSFAACMRVLLFDPGVAGKAGVNKIMLTAALAMSIFATLDIAFGLRHMLDAFIWYTGPGGPNEEFENISYWVNVMKTVDFFFQTVIGDIILIYRCYIVYRRRWLVIAFPLTVWIATLVCGSATTYITVHLRVESNVDEQHLVPWVTASMVLTMAQNLFTTTLIAIRIWSIDHDISQHSGRTRRKSKLRPVLRIIIESGAIYTTTYLIFLVVFLLSNNAQYAVSDCAVQIVGIVFNMIITRVHQGRTLDQEAETLTRTTIGFSSHTTSSQGTLAHGRRPLPFSKIKSRSTAEEPFPMSPVQVNVVHELGHEHEDNPFSESTAHIEPK